MISKYQMYLFTAMILRSANILYVIIVEMLLIYNVIVYSRSYAIRLLVHVVFLKMLYYCAQIVYFAGIR